VVASGKESSRGLYLMHLSLHGLVRGFDMELGRDADTGGQITYVVELARMLAEHPAVDRVDLLTRRIDAKGVDDSYAVPVEVLCPGAQIIRVPFGPKRYLRKEKLWPYLDIFVDRALHHIVKLGRVPDVIHAHYADAGYAGAQLARVLGVPFVFTGHSLGRVKLQRMLDKGGTEESFERRFNFNARIEAEEVALDTAARVVVSTHQEIEEQYALYDNYQPTRMKVIAPGVDLNRFSPPKGGEWQTKIGTSVRRFLKDESLPIVLAIARPDERKNFPTLIEAFAENAALREKANLVIIAGNRENLNDLTPSSRKVLRTIMRQIDQYDLYGHVAYPKQHEPADVPDAYRLAASTGGVFVNPALTEPFGLTLIEAAASGLPLVATDDGGPRDIIGACQNGLLVDPLKAEPMGEAILSALSDKERWQEWSNGGQRRCYDTYSWRAHVERYVELVTNIAGGYRSGDTVFDSEGTRLPTVDRVLMTKIDETLTADPEGLRAFLEKLKGAGSNVGFGVASGKRLPDVLEKLKKHEIPVPDLLITSAGTEIYYGKTLVPDPIWEQHIRFRWNPDGVREAMAELKGLSLQTEQHQSPFKVSYILDQEKSVSTSEIQRYLRSKGLRVNVISSFGKFIDLLPIRASTGLAIRHVLLKWALNARSVLAVGSSGNEAQMLSGNTLGVVVGHYSPEIKYLRGRPRIFFTTKEHAWGVLEGIEHYDFFGDIQIPLDDDEPAAKFEELRTDTKEQGEQADERKSSPGLRV
jgi:sucrose-phosphate synthase